MRICFIAHGRFSHLDAYIDFFARRGHEVCFVALAQGPSRNVPTYDVGFDGRFGRLCGKYTYLPSTLRARKVIRVLKPDVVHAHYATSAGLAAWMVNVHPWMVTAHGTDVTLGVRSFLWRRILRAIFSGADCVNTVSGDLRQMVLSLGTPSEKIEVLTLGIDTQLFKFRERTRPSATQPLRLICTRRLEAAYDHATLIKGMALLKARGIPFTLTLIGEGSMRQPLERLARRLQVAERIAFLGEMPNTRLPEQLAAHDVYLSASLRDGTSLSLLEAMSVGLYPVVSEIAANSDWISHDVNGLLHKVSDPESLAGCIASRAGSGHGVNEVLMHNRQLVMDRGDRTRNMKRLEQIYLRLIEARRGEVDASLLAQSI